VTSAGRPPVPLLNVPNALTVLRLLLVPVFGWVFLSHPFDISWRWLSTVVLVVALATDFIDGKIARKYNLITNFGKLWDPIADKAITGMAFIALSIVGELAWWATILILVREWGITLMRFLIIKWGVMAANRGGKAKTMLQSWVLGIWVAPFHLYFDDVPLWLTWPKLILMAATVIITVVTGLDYLREAKKLHDRYVAGQASP
jgi:CDP-diacylglycerol--glycerol-3-phosphate 3-phosphatidyltransferase